MEHCCRCVYGIYLSPSILFANRVCGPPYAYCFRIRNRSLPSFAPGRYLKLNKLLAFHANSYKQEDIEWKYRPQEGGRAKPLSIYEGNLPTCVGIEYLKYYANDNNKTFCRHTNIRDAIGYIRYIVCKYI